MVRKIVVVESPAKARTIAKYLGDPYDVLASYGHVRDLPSKKGSVLPEDDFSMVWEVDKASEKRLKEITKKCREADELILATDPDREGEAIAWHVFSEIRKKRGCARLPVHRVVFHEITKKAILKAMESPSALNQELVDAYLARRAMDYLVGFTLSPVLWRKVPGARSAGRVQSVALRFVCEREEERELFVPEEYWTLTGEFLTENKALLVGDLTHIEGVKLKKRDIKDKASADEALKKAHQTPYRVEATDQRLISKAPPPPFMTSTLQQEGSQKLHLSVGQVMSIAQKLYEGLRVGNETVGLITYMRTDSLSLSAEAVELARQFIRTEFGEAFCPEAPRRYASKVRNAQEAHEAIRPTHMARTPESLKVYLDYNQMRLYTLIWKRALASQMANASIEKVGVNLSSSTGSVTFRCVGSRVLFDGYQALYDTSEQPDRLLPPLQEGETLELQKVQSQQHFTQPPPRYTEATLVKTMEEAGIGRPSTYASILKVLQARQYVVLKDRRFVPQGRGSLVTTFLKLFFEMYMDYGFTAAFEKKLDHIAQGEGRWKEVMKEFWFPFHKRAEEVQALSGTEVRSSLDEILGTYFFKSDDHSDPRLCPLCGEGRLSVNFSRWGMFIGCSHHPTCSYTRSVNEDVSQEASLVSYPRVLGANPATGAEVTLCKGPYGFYFQEPSAEEPKEAKKKKATKTKKKVKEGKKEAKKTAKAEKKKQNFKRASLPKSEDPESVTLERALQLLSLPLCLGVCPETGEEVYVHLGRYGPYLKRGKSSATLPSMEALFKVTLEEALVLLKASKKSYARTLGEHPDGGAVELKRGRFGPYISYKGHNVRVDAGQLDTITLEEALRCIEGGASSIE